MSASNLSPSAASVVYDVAVLGAGITGTAAALAAAESGARVCVVAGAPGSSALFSGAWRGALPDRFRAHLERAGYPLRDCDHPLPHPHGALQRCQCTPPAHYAARMAGRVLVCGVAGLSGFEAAALARAWSNNDADVRAATITFASTPRSGWSPASLAAHIERNPAELIAALQAVTSSAGYDVVILPAVLGLGDSQQLRAAVQDAAGVKLAEALGVPPSLPGWRLHNALARALRSADVPVFEGRARISGKKDSMVETVATAGSSIRARSFVLATGKFVAGGIEADGELREPVFDCPIWIEHLDNVFTSAEPLMLTDPERTESQPLLRAGVHCDERQRPIDREGDVVYANVFVAGSVRADWESASHGAGDCATDGWSAGQRAVQP